MKIAFVSDTHGKHGKLTQQLVPHRADVLVHCGDFTTMGRYAEVADFADWCAMLLRKAYVRHVVAIAGNHDLLFDRTHEASIAQPDGRVACVDRLRHAGVNYLEDDATEIEGVRFAGVPWTGRFFDWAFQIDGTEHDHAVFAAAAKTDPHVLVTHGPPLGVLDLAPGDRRVGSPALRELTNRGAIGIVACGHIHEGYGLARVGPTLVINASTCTGDYRPTNPAIVVETF